VQLTDFENAAIVAVIRLLAEVIVDERWNLIIPISLSDENDAASATQAAAVQGRFWFHGSVFGNGGVAEKRPLVEILAGEGGIFTRCRRWLDTRCEAGHCSTEARDKLCRYMTLFERRARGELPTPATFLRGKLRHPEYKGDGILPVTFVHDLCHFAAEANRPGYEELDGLLGGDNP